MRMQNMRLSLTNNFHYVYSFALLNSNSLHLRKIILEIFLKAHSLRRLSGPIELPDEQEN